jgi:hypothetical protein
METEMVSDSVHAEQPEYQQDDGYRTNDRKQYRNERASWSAADRRLRRGSRPGVAAGRSGFVAINPMLNAGQDGI